MLGFVEASLVAIGRELWTLVDHLPELSWIKIDHIAAAVYLLELALAASMALKFRLFRLPQFLLMIVQGASRLVHVLSHAVYELGRAGNDVILAGLTVQLLHEGGVHLSLHRVYVILQTWRLEVHLRHKVVVLDCLVSLVLFLSELLIEHTEHLRLHFGGLRHACLLGFFLIQVIRSVLSHGYGF